MMNGFPWLNCHGKANMMETEVQSECVSFLDCKQVMTASDTVQQEIVAPGSSYPLYSKPGGNEITTVIVPEKFSEFLLYGMHSTTLTSSQDLEFAFMADSDDSSPNCLDFDQDVQPLIMDCWATCTLT